MVKLVSVVRYAIALGLLVLFFWLGSLSLPVNVILGTFLIAIVASSAAYYWAIKSRS